MHRENRDGANVRMMVGFGVMTAAVLLGLGLFFALGDVVRTPLSSTFPATSSNE